MTASNELWIAWRSSGVQNMRERGSTAPRHFYFARHFLLIDEKLWQGAGGSKVYFFARHFILWKYLKCPGKCGSKGHFCRAFFMEIFKVLWTLIKTWSNVVIYALCLIWLKCRDLSSLPHFGWNVVIWRFARHKMSAPRLLKLFCTPAQTWHMFDKYTTLN